MSKYIINLDLHGGDFAPQSVLEGALIAQTKNSSIKFNLHSDRHIFEKFKSSFSNYLITLNGHNLKILFLQI